MTTTHSPDPAPLALEERAPGRTSPSHPLTFRIGAALDLKEPAIKEANGSNLDPIAAKDRLTLVVPANAALRPDDRLIVMWVGAAGTPAGGSHTSTPRPVSEGLEFPIPNSVVAFNLGQPVTVRYTVTRGDAAPKPSLPLTLAVLPIADGDANLTTPTIDGADNAGNQLDVTKLADAARVRVAPWPLIAVGQKIWLRLQGTTADGTPFDPAPLYAGTTLSSGGLAGVHTQAPVAALRGLKDGSSLRIEFKVTFDGSANEATAVTFPVRTYTVKALVALTPEITSVKDSADTEIPEGGTTVDTTVTLSGTATAGQKVEIFDGLTTSKGTADVDGDGVWTHRVTGLAVGGHSFTAKGLYGSNPVSPARTIKVAAALTPAITSVKDSAGREIPEGGNTVDTTVTLTGNATSDLKVEIRDHTTFKGTADVNGNGVWTLRVTSLAAGGHSFTAKGLYGSGPVSPARTLTVTPPLSVSPDPMNLNGVVVRIDGWTPVREEMPGNTETRVASGGLPPYTYVSSNPSIASVTLTGKVTGNANGTATITVTDSNQRTASYSVTVSNVFRLMASGTFTHYSQAVAWMNQTPNASPIEAAQVNAMKLLYGWLPLTSHYWLPNSNWGCRNAAAFYHFELQAVHCADFDNSNILGAWFVIRT
ncbi:Ig-like domain-containing protein [Pseudomonas sp. A-B-19]|uniref:Ig-like domain-containing protein n=1 Tax=Pseudomonas sp. A-B-19 TaxID=2832405 RepID=UPI001CBB4A58|nr:Ig-like domain-containing protein [Pseudomonas sp. A-B-19]